MKNVLVSFLGRASGGKPNERSYQETCYRFESGGDKRSRYFALALLEWLTDAGTSVDALVLLGTPGSMWDVFYYQNADGSLDDRWLEQTEALKAKASRNEISQADVDAIASDLSAMLQRRVVPIIIPPARTPAEQTDILRSIAEATAGASNVYLDVTHGYRHLPMLGLAASRFLRILRNIDVKEIYYGAHEMRQGDVSPVVRLGGLSTLLVGLEALSAFDHSGDYGVFEDLFRRAGVSHNIIVALREAAFFERQSAPSKARARLVTVLQAMDSWHEPTLSLLRDSLMQRMSWVKGKGRPEWELELASRYLDLRDYVRAATYCQEGLISLNCARLGLRTEDRNDREQAREDLRVYIDGFRDLSDIRNALTHGLRDERARVIAMLTDENLLRKHLESMLSAKTQITRA
jgi:CRISPR-associated Csx2 family protein